MALKRGFRVEVKKLQKDPPLLSNREAVEMFLDCLTPEFRLLITSRLDIANKEIPEGTRPEDKYKLDDVVDTAITLGKGSRVTYKALDGVATMSSKRGDSDEGSMKLEAELCILKDTFVTQNKQSEAHMNRLASRIEEMTKQFTSSMNKMAAPQLSGQSQPAYRPAINMGGLPPFRQNINATQSGCFYCGEEGHLKNECPHRTQHLNQGWIIVDATGRVRMADGSPIVWGRSGESTKERVEATRNRTSTAQVNINTRANIPGIIQFNQNSTPLAGFPQDRIEDLLEQLDVNDVQQFLMNKYTQAGQNGEDFYEV